MRYLFILFILIPGIAFSAACDPSDYTCTEIEVLLDTVNTMDQTVLTSSSPTFVTVTTTTGATANGGLLVDSLPDTNQTCQCIGCSTETAGATIDFGDILTLDVATGKYILADANDDALLYGRAIACNPAQVEDTDPIEVMSIGWIRDDSWVFTDDINKHIVLDDTAGDFVLFASAPADVGDLVQILGHVTAETALGLNIDVWFFNPEYNGKVLE